MPSSKPHRHHGGACGKWAKTLCALALIALSVAGCGLAQTAALKERSAAGMQDCDVRFPKDDAKIAVSRAQCLNDALAILRPTMPYPDLLDQYLAIHMALAEQVQKGQLTIAQGNAAIAQKKSELAAEEQRRSLASRSVVAQENRAAAAAAPVVVTVPSSQPAPSPQPAPTIPSCADGYACAGRTLQGDGRWH
jgi:hypothetical protein